MENTFFIQKNKHWASKKINNKCKKCQSLSILEMIDIKMVLISNPPQYRVETYCEKCGDRNFLRFVKCSDINIYDIK